MNRFYHQVGARFKPKKEGCMESEPILITSEAARLLEVTPNTVRWHANKKLLRAIRTETGTRIFYRRDVEALAIQRQASKRKRTPSRG
jgi:hypothetical protein